MKGRGYRVLGSPLKYVPGHIDKWTTVTVYSCPNAAINAT